MFNFYTRHTISWKVECEGLNFARAAILEEMEMAEEVNYFGAWETVIWTVLIVLTQLNSTALFWITARTYSSMARVV
jgi:hypothetical protein